MAIYTIKHNSQTKVTRDINVSPSELKAHCVSVWPDVANAQMNISDDNVVTFSMPPGTKN